MDKLNKSIPTPLPERIADLPLTDTGYPVPWFASWIDGKPELRVVDSAKIATAIRHGLCWICGQRLGSRFAFTIGPMCVINRITSEPPAHYDCAHFAVRACPFLTKPGMKRNAVDLPLGHKEPAGHHIPRNPGVTAIWISRGYQVHRVDNGILFQIGDSERVEWWREAREATWEEVVESIESGFPALLEMARAEGDAALFSLARGIAASLPTLPKPAPGAAVTTPRDMVDRWMSLT